MRNYKLWLMTVTSITLIFFLGGLILIQGWLIPNKAQAQTGDETTTPLPQTITVVGEGTVNVEPDIAQANIGIQVTNTNLSQATSEAQQTMQAILTALQDQGIAEQDTQTSNFSIFVERPVDPQGQPTQEIIYHVSNDVNVIIRDLESVGTVLEVAIDAGANNIYGVNFGMDDSTAAQSEARAEALDNAVNKAQELAQLAGIELGEVVSISEVVAAPSPLTGAGFRAEIGGGAPPISPGQLEVTTRLEVVYRIQ